MNILILGGCGFIGSHLAKRFMEEGHHVHVADIKQNEYIDRTVFCSQKTMCDLRDPNSIKSILAHTYYDEVYQLAADMGGAGYIFTGEHDADVMHNSALINLNVAHEVIQSGNVGRVFYSSSACMYPAFNQEDPDNPNCEESSAYPAAPDSEYGWEKLFSERMYKSYERNYALQVRIARYHNVFGPLGTYKGDRAKAPAAICRKVAEAVDGTSIDIWGDGTATRSFIYIDEAVEGIIRLMRSDCKEILNLGSEEMISINDLAKMVIRISSKNLTINNIPGPTGVRGRNSHNALIYKELGWKPLQPLEDGMRKLYTWVNEQVQNSTI
jgi:nucleoside-diphosphate-sugar epimerase